jgi:transcriptional regulator with XRE-family HTH domain
MPITEALRAELAQYLIGPKLRALRLRRSMGLTQLGQRTSLSPALLSKIENGKLVPTIPTLLRIATVFEVTLDHFFQNEHRRRIISLTRKQERVRAAERQLASGESYDLERLDLGAGERKFHPYLAEFFPVKPGHGRPHMHQGYEFLHILSGRLELSIGSDETVLEPGDSIYFDPNLRHAYRSLDEKPCRALMVLAYPERNLAERRMDHLAALHGGRRPPALLARVNGNARKAAEDAADNDTPTNAGGRSSPQS